MTSAALLLLGIASWWLTGFAVVSALSGRGAERPALGLTERSGLALVLGLGLTSVGALLGSGLGVPLGRPFSFAWGAAGSLLGLAALARELLRRRSGECPSHRDWPRPGPFGRLAQRLVLLIGLALFVQALLTPQRLWDERAIFGIKGVVLFEDGSIDSPALRDPDFVQYHPRYPLLLPLAETYVYGWLGRVEDRWAKVVPPLLAGGLWLTFAGVLSRRIGAGPAWLWTLLLATVPALTTWEYGYLSAQADALVATFHGVSVLYVWDWLTSLRTESQPVTPEPIPPLRIAGIAAGLALFTKDEGIALALVDGLALAILVLGLLVRRSPRAVLQTITRAGCGYGLAGLLLIAAPWFWHRRTLPTTTEMTYFDRLNWEALIAGSATLPWSLQHLATRMGREAMTWGLQWWGAVVALLLAPRRALSLPQLFLLLDLAGAVAALLLAGMLAPTPVDEHLGGSSHRFLLQLTPVGLLFASAQFHGTGEARPESSTGQLTPGPAASPSPAAPPAPPPADA